ncbi:MAG TPA: FAD-linked oxidase C-terminal domain-containing protein [Rhabdaerophilum sp.]|nr:FAD-linked oxidase C-terminal domain-containing protein [Rhabdaerophilum sp.]
MGARAATRDTRLERRLKVALRGDVRFGMVDRGLYATDASIYQIMPQGVILPADGDDLSTTLAIAAEEDIPVTLRGAGTSQNGQPLGSGLIVDCSRYLDRILDYDPEGRRVRVEPGLVLEQLNARLRVDGLFFPVEPSTGSRCTLGGMTGNNACGARSLHYGKMVDNVRAISAFDANGNRLAFGADTARSPLVTQMLALAEHERDEILARFPKVQRRVGGYNLDALLGKNANSAHLLVGSEGTLAAFTEIELALMPLPAHRVMGVCQFPTFRAAMEMTRHLVALGPTAVELVDRNALDLGSDIAIFRETLRQIAQPETECLLLVEFAGDDAAELRRALIGLDTCMADHGFPACVVAVFDPGFQRRIWQMRESCLNIMMSMKGDGKPVSFIEDCAVPLEHLAAYTDAMNEVFTRHGTRGTWYAHASVGCLHVRPILNMKSETGRRSMRAIAEETVDLVRKFEGSYSGEHGDGISRSEFIEPMFGGRLTRAFEAVKDAFDPDNRLNPGKIVRPMRFDDPSLMRFPPGYSTQTPCPEGLDWSAWGGFGGAVEMCNNNGTCRKLAGGTMCPTFRASRDEVNLTRGRANALRLALSGAHGGDALLSSDVEAAMAHCLGCKSCQAECPTGVDMARMKIEFLHQRHQRSGLSFRDRLFAYLPAYAPAAARIGALLNHGGRSPFLRWSLQKTIGLAASVPLPQWRTPWVEPLMHIDPRQLKADGRELVLLADTFNRYFEPENLEATKRVFTRAGYHLIHPRSGFDGRPLCCGRTYLSLGLIDRARAEATRLATNLLPYVERGARIVGLEPSCLVTIRDEYAALLPPDLARPLARAAFLAEEILANDRAEGRIDLAFANLDGERALLHGHCHQKAAGAFAAVEACLSAIPGLQVEVIDSGCCGMAGNFGYQVETADFSRRVGELTLLPAVREATPNAHIIADGTSCRHQIENCTDKLPLHAIHLIDKALKNTV